MRREVNTMNHVGRLTFSDTGIQCEQFMIGIEKLSRFEFAKLYLCGISIILFTTCVFINVTFSILFSL